VTDRLGLADHCGAHDAHAQRAQFGFVDLHRNLALFSVEVPQFARQLVVDDHDVADARPRPVGSHEEWATWPAIVDVIGAALLGVGTTELFLWLHKRHDEEPSRWRIFAMSAPDGMMTNSQASIGVGAAYSW